MSVIQENHFTCDLCGRGVSTREIESVHSSNVISYPPGWGSLTVPIEFRDHPNNDCIDACASCNAAPNWTRYVVPNWTLYAYQRK